jgi:beta-fructofuranosidase
MNQSIFAGSILRQTLLALTWLNLLALSAWASPPAAGRSFVDKTLVVWATVAHTEQNSAVITLENPPSEFDSLVFGEIKRGKWMVGSDYFLRTERAQESFPRETASPDEVLQLAIVYHGKQATLYRNGDVYASHTMANPAIGFTTASHVLIGLHHSDVIGAPCFAGTVDDARIYDRALSQAELRSLQPNEEVGPKPLGWWTFDDNTDRQEAFPPGQVVGQAKIAEGKLDLFGGFFAVNLNHFRNRDEEEWPIYHLHARPAEGLARPYDANGCIFKDGVYHLMYIYQDRRRPREGHSWGHCTSTDLVNWTYRKPALQPDPGDPDVGIFSGNAFLGKDGQPMLCWFGIDAGVCVATTEDGGLVDWKKHPGNPVIPIPEQGRAVFGKSAGAGKYFVWDPYMWYDGGNYYCLLGGNALPSGKDTLFLMKSADLETWKPLHPFYEHADPTWTVPGEDCSCPDFFQLGDKHILLCISHSVGSRCYIGDLQDERFFPQQHVRMNWPGGNFFAPESLADDQGRRVFWGWVTDPRTISTQTATGSGVMSLPRVMSLSAQDQLRIAPAPELEALRRNQRSIGAIDLPADRDVPLGVSGKHIELRLQIDVRSAREIGLKVRCSPDHQEETVIRFSPVNQQLSIDSTNSTLRRDVIYAYHPLDTGGLRRPRGEKHPCSVTTAPLSHPAYELLELRVFLDGPVLEVFAGETLCLTQQIFPLRSDSIQISAFARGGNGRIAGGDAWEMSAARFD